MHWRKEKAIINLIIFVPIIIGIIIYFIADVYLIDKTQKKTKVRMVEFSDAIRIHKLNMKKELKVIPLNENIVTTCVNGKKVIIVNKKIYYFGTIDSWGDIQGVDCEE